MGERGAAVGERSFGYAVAVVSSNALAHSLSPRRSYIDRLTGSLLGRCYWAFADLMQQRTNRAQFVFFLYFILVWFSSLRPSAHFPENLTRLETLRLGSTVRNSVLLLPLTFLLTFSEFRCLIRCCFCLQCSLDSDACPVEQHR